MRVEIINSHFRQNSFHFTGAFLSHRFHLSLRYVYIYDWTKHVIIIVDENDLKSLRFNHLPIANDIFKSIIKLYFLHLHTTTHFFLLSEHSIDLNVGIFIWELIGAEKLFIVNICLSWVLGTVENSVSPLHLFFLSNHIS